MARVKAALSKRWNVKGLAVVFVCGLFLFAGDVAGRTPSHRKKGYSYKTLRILARLYMACGNYEKAQPLAERAVTLAKAKSASDPELCSCLIDLAYLYKHQGKLDDAEKTCELGLELQEKLYYKNHPYVAYTLRILSDIYQGRGKYRQAGDVLEKAMAIMLTSHLPGDRALAPFQVDIAKLLAAQGNLADAEAYYMRALDSINNNYGPNHLYTARVIGSIAKLYTLQKRYTEAQSLINRALVVQEKTYGQNHHFLASTWLTIAMIRQAKKNYTEAEQLLQNALIVVEENRGPEHPMTGKVLSSLGAVYIDDGKYKEAESTCLRAVNVLEDSLGADNDSTAVALNNLARLYIHQQKYAEAKNLCHRALSALESIFDQNHPSVADVLETLALLQYRIGNTAEAAKLEQRAEEIRASKHVAYEPVAKALTEKNLKPAGF